MRSHQLSELYPAVYLHRSLPPGANQDLWAAALWSRGTVSHRSAAPLWSVEVPRDAEVTVTTGDRRFRGKHAGIKVYRLDLPPSDCESVAGLPVTARSRTIIDLLRTEDPKVAIALMDRAVQQGWLSIERVRRELVMHPGHAGNNQLRELLGRAEPGADAESERVLHRLLHGAGLTGWKPQLRVQLPQRVVYLDVAFPDALVGIEVDGRRYHGEHSDRFESDRARQNELTVAGWLILRFTWRRLCDDPAGVVREVRAALNARSAAILQPK